MEEYNPLNQPGTGSRDQSGGGTPAYAGKYSAAVWDEVRTNFHNSIMVDTKLKSLAENVGMSDWPIKSVEETPSKYIDLTFEQLLAVPGVGDNSKRIDLLISILKETLAFDDPFGDMVEQVEAASKREDNLLKNVNNLGIPLDYPIGLTNLTDETKQFCKQEELKTIGQFIEFSQNMAQSIVVGGDFKSFLNSLAHIDEEAIAKVLPFQVRNTGFHLPEAVGLIIDNLSEAERVCLLRKYGGTLSEAEASVGGNLSNDQMEQLESIIKGKIEELKPWFEKEREEMKKQVESGRSLDRYFGMLNDPNKELIAANMMVLSLGGEAAGKKKGLFSAFSRMFKKS